MYTEISLKLSEHELAGLAAGHSVRITAEHFSGGSAHAHHPLCVTSTQLKQLRKVAEGKQKYTALKLSAACIKRCAKQFGGSFFGSIGKTLKNTFTTPSGLLGMASMLPTPLSTPLKAASVVAKLTGNGRSKPRAKKVRASHGGSFFGSLGSTLKNTFTKPSGIMGIASMLPTPLSTPLKAASVVAKLTGNGRCISNHHNTHAQAIDNALIGMGFRPHHIEHMKGCGVFSNIWSGIRKLGTILKPYLETEGRRMLDMYGPMVLKGVAKHAMDSYMGRGVSGAHPQYIVKFTKPQLAYIKREMTGNGVFGDISSFFGGNLTTLGSR